MTASPRQAQTAPVTIRDAMTDRALFGDTFGSESWAAWRALLAGFYGLALNDAEAEHWHTLTGLAAPTEPSEELWLVIGRRGGKSQCAALMAVYEAAFRDHRPHLAPGEVATVMILAADRRQARTVARYVRGLIESNAMLKRMVVRDGTEGIELSNGCAIEIHTASFRAVRGYSVACCIADEIAFWRSEDSANPDFEVIAALRPAMATLGGKLVALSSPYSRRGALWDTYRRHYGEDSPVLVAQAASRTMNPQLPERVVTEAMERDPDAARAEYMATFRRDIETFIQRETVEGCMRVEPLELPYVKGNRYQAFADPAGGGGDGYTLAIGHVEDEGKDDERIVVDVVRERHGVPADITAEYSKLLAAYGVKSITSDRYGGSWPADEFKRHNITAETSAKPKSDLYVDALATLNSGRIELPPSDRLLNQLVNLERRTSRGGRDSIDHPPGGHDDIANAVAGLAQACQRRRGSAVTTHPIRGLV